MIRTVEITPAMSAALHLVLELAHDNALSSEHASESDELQDEFDRQRAALEAVSEMAGPLEE